MKKRKCTFKLYRKIYPKASAYARKEYMTDNYDREWLRNGYYHGYVDGAKALHRRVKTLMGKEIADSLLELTLGKPKVITA